MGGAEQLVVLCGILRCLIPEYGDKCEETCKSDSGIEIERDQVVTLNFTGPQLSGRLPTDLGKIQTLHDVRLGYSRLGDMDHESKERGYLQGGIPSELSSLQVKVLRLRSNWLTGRIPTEIGRLEKIEELDLSNNRLKGTVPSELADLKTLTKLDLSWNSLVGSIPKELGKLHEMKKLNIVRCQLEGTLPSELGYIPDLENLAFHKNFLEGTLPSEYGKWPLRKLALASNNLRGTIPAEYGRGNFQLIKVMLARNSLGVTLPLGFPGSGCNIIVLHVNKFEGRLQDRAIDWGKDNPIIALTLHSNRFGGRVPTFTLHSSRASVMTLHGNFLSCTLPEFVFAIGAEHDIYNWGRNGFKASPLHLRRMTALIGNEFCGPLPSWVPEDKQDPILYHAEGVVLKFFLIGLSGILLLLLSVAFVLKSSTLSFVMPMLSGFEPMDLPCEQYAVFALAFFKMAILSVVLKVLYGIGGKVYECNPYFSFSYLGNAFVVEIVIGCCFIAHYALAITCLNQLAQDTEHVDILQLRQGTIKVFAPKLRNVLPWCGWGLVVTLFSVPSITFVTFLCMPRDNIISHFYNSRLVYTCGISSAIVSTIVLNGLLPSISRFYGGIFKLYPSQLLIFGRLCGFSFFPATMVFIFHENCLAYWRHFWTICECGEHSIGLDIFYKSKQLLRTRELCRIPPLMQVMANKKCGRSVVNVMGSLLLQKVLFEAVVMPLFSLWTNYMVSLSPGFFTRLKFFGNPLHEKMSRHLSKSHQLANFATWLSISISWAPLLPVLQPIILLALATNLLVHQISIRWLHINPIDKDPCCSEARCQPIVLIHSALGFLLTVIACSQIRVYSAWPLCVLLVGVLSNSIRGNFVERSRRSCEASLSCEVELAEKESRNSEKPLISETFTIDSVKPPHFKDGESMHKW